MLKKYAYAPLAIMLALSAQTSSADNPSNMTSFAYLSIPLGATTQTQSEPTYGFAVSNGNRTNDLFSSKRPRLFDMSFRKNQLDNMQIHGISALEKTITHNANGTTDTTFGVNTGALVAGLVATGIGLCIGDVICDDIGNDNKKNPDPETEGECCEEYPEPV